jgi:hypothetical protein
VFLILRRLNKAIKAVELSDSTIYSSGVRNRRSLPSEPDLDAMSVDPLMMSPSEASGRIRTPYSRAGRQHSIDGIPSNSDEGLPRFRNAFPPQSQPQLYHPIRYTPVSGSESEHPSSSSRHRGLSLESSSRLNHNPNAGYFDLPPQSGRRASQNYVAERQSSQHRGILSSGGDQNLVVASCSAATEPDAQTHIDKRSNIRKALRALGRGPLDLIRKKQQKDSVVLSGDRGRPGRPANSKNHGLAYIPEAAESRVHIDLPTSTEQTAEVSLLDTQVPSHTGRDGIDSQELAQR